MEPICFLDMDGVITNFAKAAHQIHGRMAVYRNWPYKRGYYHWIADWKMPSTEFWAPMGRNFWRGLEWTKDGRKILDLVVQHFSERNVYLLTSPCLTEGCIEGKRDWVRDNDSFLAGQMIFAHHKHVMASERTTLIDDSLEQVNNFIAAGGNAIVVPRIWNPYYEFSDALKYINIRLEQLGQQMARKLGILN